MAGFKDQVRRDLKHVFFNAEEHADKLPVAYNGKTYNIPVIIDYEGARDRTKTVSDHADGVFITDLTVYISFYDLKTVPCKETEITIDDIPYKIVKVGCDAGQITLDLELFGG